MTIKANKRTYAIGLFLLTGWTPWGVKLLWSGISLVGGESGKKGGAEWIMCCGHVLSRAEMDLWIAEELAAPDEPDRFGRPQVKAGPKLERWLGVAFEGLRAKTWGNAE